MEGAKLAAFVDCWRVYVEVPQKLIGDIARRHGASGRAPRFSMKHYTVYDTARWGESGGNICMTRYHHLRPGSVSVTVSKHVTH